MIVAFRTHLWNEEIERLARRLYGYCIGADFIVLADETRAVLDTGPFKKLPHKSDFSEFLLPNFPNDNILWYNADYPLYILRKAFPDHSHYAMIEYDVAVNVDLANIMRYAESNAVDLIAHNMWPSSAPWDWYFTAEAHFSRPWQCFIAAVIVSGRSIDHMLRRRQEIYQKNLPETYRDWPFCEAFFATVIAELDGSKMEEFNRHAKLPLYSHLNSFHIDDPETMLPGTIAHPVLSGPGFINKRLSIDPIQTIFDRNSWLRRHLSFCKPSEFTGPVYRAILNLNSADDEVRFITLAREQGWPTELLRRNIALGKPALSSSTSQMSRNTDPSIDARGGNDGNIQGGFGFYTDLEMDPWWQVDLEAEHKILSVVLFNYMDRKHVSLNLAIASSIDGEDWTLRAAKLDKEIFGGVDGNPYKFQFEPSFQARFIRVSLIGDGHLHLDEIEIYGAALPQ